MSEYMKDSGHHDMRTCDDCGGAFYASRGPMEEAEDWTCDHCEKQSATLKALADALAGDSGKGHDRKGEHGIQSCNTCCYVEPHHADSCPVARALRLAGRL